MKGRIVRAGSLGGMLNLILVVSACALIPRSTGKVSLTLGGEGASKTILPTITVVSYQISFSGPVVRVPLSTTESNPTIDIEVGTWDISVEGRDGGGNTVAVGSTNDVIVTENATTPVSIVLRAQSSGSGAIDVTVTWPGSVSPEIDTVEVTVDGAAVNAGTLSSGGSPLTWVRYVEGKVSGSYQLQVLLKSAGGTVLRASVQEEVLVYDNLDSSATIALTELHFASAPAPPSGLVVIEGLAKLVLSWVDNSHLETGYTIERGTDGIIYRVIESISAPATSYEDTTAGMGQTYYYQLKATNSFGASNPSGSASGKVEAPVAGGAGVLTFSEVASSSIVVSWQKATDNLSAQTALAYKVVWSLADNVQTVADAENNGIVVQDWAVDISSAGTTGLSAGTACYFNVLVRDTAGNRSPYMSNVKSTALAVTQVIADHTVVDRYGEIPQYWIDQVKKMWLNVPGESHSEAYRVGLQLLMAQDSRFAVNVTESGDPEGYTEEHLRASRATWGDIGWPSGWNYWGYGEEDWYTTSAAVALTKAHIQHCHDNSVTVAAIGFGWCWDMTWTNGPGGGEDPVWKVHWAGSSANGPEGNLLWGLDAEDFVLTGNSVCMDSYLEATQGYVDYCMENGIPTKVFFTTGPVDGYSGESGYQRQVKHDHIRRYVVEDQSRILFDYADILAWSNSGEQNTQVWTDAYAGGHSYQMVHADNMLNLAGTGTSPEVGHIGERGALRLAKALWWMLARLAGWPG